MLLSGGGLCGALWTRSAPNWACLDAVVPPIEGQPPPVG